MRARSSDCLESIGFYLVNPSYQENEMTNTMTVTKTEHTQMNVAMLIKPGSALERKRIDRPSPRVDEVLIRVRSAAALPHQRLAYSGSGPFLLPELPAVAGWDSCGEIVEKGDAVETFSIGDRVYLYPIITCGDCHYCRKGSPLCCEAFMLQGGFGLSESSATLQRRHRSGAFAEYQSAPSNNAVLLPDSVSFDTGVRFGYAGVSFRALRRGEVGPGKRVLINGATGNLGVLATQLALALGVDQVIAVARNRERLDRLVNACDDRRLQTVSTEDGPVDVQVSALTDGRGIDVAIDFLDSSAGATPEAVASVMSCLSREGVLVVVGAILDQVPFSYMQLVTQDCKIIGSHGYTTAQGKELMSMIRSGVFQCPHYDTQSFQLTDVNDALDAVWSRPGGFANVVINP